MTEVRIYEITGSVPPPNQRVRIYNIDGSVPTATQRVRVYQLDGSVPDTFSVEITPTPTDLDDLEPGTEVTLVGSATGGTVTLWTWEISDASVTLVGTGDTRTLTIPARNDPGFFSVTATASGTGASEGSATVNITTLPHLHWYAASGGGWLPLYEELLEAP